MKYVMADIHGCFDKFIKMLEKINFSEKDTLYILGDIIDRGPEPIKMIQYVMKHKNIILLKGNHEAMMLICLLGRSLSNNIIWDNNGGGITYDQFEELSEKEQNQILDYLKKIPNYIIVDDKILVHAGIYNRKISTVKTIEENMENQYEDDLLWIRDEFLFAPTTLEGYTVIFGHTPTQYMSYIQKPMKIWHDKLHEDKIGIDCGCVFEDGQLACLCLDTMEEFYI